MDKSLNSNIKIDEQKRGQRIFPPLEEEISNEETIRAINEGHQIARSSTTKGFHSMDELKKALGL